MEHHGFHSAGVTIALALAAGMVAQTLARHVRLPGIVLLLAAGVLLGPDVAGVVLPETVGGALQLLVGFAVAVILFEGGLHLDLRRLARQAGVIRRLLTVGALVTALGGGLAAYGLMGWDWRLAVLFGTLVIVTGPTVITPLLRRIKVKQSVETVLEAEGVLIDAVGAVIAVVAFEVVISPSGTQAALGLAGVVGRLGFGVILGVAGGLLLAGLLRVRQLVPEGLSNVLILTLVLALFQVSNAILAESGIMTVTAAGVVLGNLKLRGHRQLVEFKEQLVVMFIGMLFVLLAADVRLADVVGLGRAGLAVVLLLMFVVRPLNILACTWGSGLDWRERVFLSWLAPRGVVAAAVASLFAESVGAYGIEGGTELRALVFLVIAVTVVVQGLSGGSVAWSLGLRRPKHLGFVILGANELGRTIARLLRGQGHEVVFLDANPVLCKAAEEEGFRVVYGNALEERTLQRARLEDRQGCVTVTPNEEINLLVAQRVVQQFNLKRVDIAVRRSQSTIDADVVRKAGARLLFGRRRDLELWIVRLRREQTDLEVWEWRPDERQAATDPLDTHVACLPLVVERKGKSVPASNGELPRAGSRVHFLIAKDQSAEVGAWLREHGWQPVV